MSNEEEAVTKPERTWPHMVTLKHPIKFGDEHITALTFRRGRIGDAKGLKLKDEVPTDSLVLIAARLSGKPTNVIEMLDIDDAEEVMAIALDFYVRYLGGGKKT